MSVLRKYGAGLVLADRTLSVELFGKRLSRVAPSPTAGQVLSFNGAEWSPQDPSASMPAGTAGTVMVFDGGAWKPSASPTEGAPLVGRVGASPSWSTVLSPLTQATSDIWNNAVSVCGSFFHRSDDGFGLAGMGARCVFRVCNDDKQSVAIAAIDGVATDVTANDEFGALDVQTAELGTLTRAARFTARGVTVAYQGVAPHPTTAALAMGWSSRSIVVRDGMDFDWLNVWSVDGSNRFVFGSNNGFACGGTVITAPDNGELYLRRNATTHLAVNSSGTLVLGDFLFATVLRGLSLVVGMPTVVTEFQGGRRLSTTTVLWTQTLGASHDVVFVDTSGGALTITLPPLVAGRVITVQRVGGAADFVLERNGADLLRMSAGTATTLTITDNARRTLIARSDAAEWVIDG